MLTSFRFVAEESWVVRAQAAAVNEGFIVSQSANDTVIEIPGEVQCLGVPTS